ncbi:unnamed protein product, partial [marine sediment metagenome]
MSKTTAYLMNSRSGVMFQAIRKNINLVGADVLDLGCGYGDLVVFSLSNGARHATIVDKDVKAVLTAEQKIAQRAPEGITWESLLLDIDDRSQLAALKYYHVAFCTSVLPYLTNKDMVLSFLAARAETSVIEMQYYGDGPGPASIRDDTGMKSWLMTYWESVEKIGHSYTGRE